jgi:hypothetical protein
LYTRTKARQNHLHEQWQQVLDMRNKMAEWAKNASPEQVKQLSSTLHLPSDKSKSLGIEEIEYIVENTIQSSLGTEISTIAPALLNMQFLPTDRPCLWLMVGATNLYTGLSPASQLPCWAHKKDRLACEPILPIYVYV